VYKYRVSCFNKSVFKWTFCQLLTEKPNCTKILISTNSLPITLLSLSLSHTVCAFVCVYIYFSSSLSMCLSLILFLSLPVSYYYLSLSLSVCAFVCVCTPLSVFPLSFLPCFLSLSECAIAYSLTLLSLSLSPFSLFLFSYLSPFHPFHLFLHVWLIILSRLSLSFFSFFLFTHFCQFSPSYSLPTPYVLISLSLLILIQYSPLYYYCPSVCFLSLSVCLSLPFFLYSFKLAICLNSYHTFLRNLISPTPSLSLSHSLFLI